MDKFKDALMKITLFQQKRSLRKFTSAWEKADWAGAFQHCQRTWASNHGVGELESRLKRWDLQQVYLDDLQRKQFSNVMHRLQFPVLVGTTECMCQCMMIKELDAYTPSAFGMWGVNPVSITIFDESIQRRPE